MSTFSRSISEIAGTANASRSRRVERCGTSSSQNVAHISAARASTNRFSSRVSGVVSSSSSSLTSRITTHHASPSGSAATTAGSTVAGICANTPPANRSASRPGSRVQRPSQSDPGTIRLAIRAVPSARTSLSMRLPDHPLEASVTRSATRPSEANSSSAASGTGSAAGAVRGRAV